jgi:ribosomal protein S30
MVTFEMFLGTRIGSVLRALTEKITAINKKYETPRIRMSRSVKIALLFLRIYLILLVLLLCYKFYTLLT